MSLSRSPLPSLLAAIVAWNAWAHLPLHGSDSNWPQFRGPTGQGVSNATGLPITWSETKNIVWKTPIHGKGWSSPVIFGNQIWLTTATEDGRELSVLAFDRATGKVLHDRKVYLIENPQPCDRFNSYASPTPVIEEGRVYLSFGGAGTACLDTKTARTVWERPDLTCFHLRGPGSSPTLWRNLLILHFDGTNFQYVIALDRETGRTVWKTDRTVAFRDLGTPATAKHPGDARKAYSSPLVIEHEGTPLLVSAGSQATYGYEPMTGRELWRVEDIRYHSGSVRPVVGHGMVFTATGLAKGELWSVRLGGRGVVTDSHIAWKVTNNVPKRPSPVLSGDLLFMVESETGVVTCLEAKTGAEVWRERLPGVGHHSASPTLAEGRIYFFNENGAAVVIPAAREFKVLAQNQLDGGFMASPAIVGKALFLRTKTHLYRIEER